METIQRNDSRDDNVAICIYSKIDFASCALAFAAMPANLPFPLTKDFNTRRVDD